MTLRISAILTLLFTFSGCGNHHDGGHDMSGQPLLKSSIPDTTKGWIGKEQYQEYLLRKQLAQIFKLPDLEHVDETSEVRIWWQASIYSPSRVWIFRNQNGTRARQRIDYYLHYPGTQVDSFRIVQLDSGNRIKDSVLISQSFSAIWSLPQYYETGHNRGCTDGETVALEARSGNKYTSVSYPCYYLYKDSAEYQAFSTLVENLLALDTTQ